MKAKTEVIYTERHDGVDVEVRYWGTDKVFTYVLYWERYEPGFSVIGTVGYDKPTTSGVEALDIESDAEAQRIGIAKFDALLAEGGGA